MPDSQSLAARVRSLREVAERATIAPTIAEVARVLIEEGGAALGTAVGALWLLEDDDLVLTHWIGRDPSEGYGRIPRTTDTPVAHTVRARTPAWLEDRAAYEREFPASYARLAARYPERELAAACVPLVAGEQVIGAFLCMFMHSRAFSPGERTFLVTIAQQCAVAIERLQLIARERELRLRAEVLARGMARLQELAGELSFVTDLRDVARVFLAKGQIATGAESAGIWLVEGDDAVLLGHMSYTDAVLVDYGRIALADRTIPVAHALATGEPVFVTSRAALRDAFPEFEARRRAARPDHLVESIACIPLIVDGRTLGGVNFNWASPRAFDAPERELLVLMARHASQAVERAQLHAARERARATQRVLADAGAVLAGSLDYETTLQAIAQRLVPDVADWCFVDIAAADGAFDRVAIAHADPAMADLARSMKGHYGPLPDAALGSSRVIVHEEPKLIADFANEIQALVNIDPARARGVTELGLRSVVTAPLTVGGRVLGALSLGTTRATYDAADLELCIELARRAASAIDNARLYAAEAAARREAESASRIKDEFLAMLGHELRNPLAPIAAALQLMSEHASAPFPRERAIIERQVRHLTRLVDDLLDVSRITHGLIALRRAPMELSEAVSQALEATSGLIADRGHVLTVEVPTGLRIHADLDRVAQVIGNLLTNAARYTPRGGRVSLRATAAADAVQLVVQDTGPGLPADLLPRAFEPFAQGERGVARSDGGLGLGLAIVKNLVELHGGRVTATNLPEGGARLVVTLPIGDVAAAVGAAPATTSAAAPVPRLRVLIVDDNVDAADMLGELLRAFGHEPTVVHGARAALAVPGPAPDLAFLDIGLPDLDGYELARRLRARPDYARTTLVAVTGYGQPSDRVATTAAGFGDHLVKPVDVGTLRALLEATAAQRGRA